MEEASPFSSLEHATSFTRDLWFNKLPIHHGSARERIQETLEETGEIIQYSMLEEDAVPNSSDEVVSKGHNVSMLTFDLNKTLEENDIC
ncbi:hypothetical protein Ahy_A09g044460 [Arachis hypogaea]|uniref:Uncharacterized protein n=1 Tax=Arachis hypogaea TaxID=3818 RepID=A0A445BK49_ARAHY|nr:hypothetical protein Ahy_A09g044460 [Arachis hypogaea]